MGLTFDIRITPTTDIVQFEKNIRQWMGEAGSGLELDFIQKFTDQTLTSTAEDDPWYSALTRAFNKHQLKVSPVVCPGGTDMRYLRQVGISAIGFSPMNHTPILLHDHDEFLNEKIFLKGIDIFVDIVSSLANVKPQIFPAGTDSRYLREVGIPAIGFSPMNNTPILLHDHDEFLNETIFLRGIDIFTDIIANIADV